jgi:hypothetical protein
MSNTKNNWKQFLKQDSNFKFISLFGLIIGSLLALIIFIVALVWLLGIIGEGIDIATYNITLKTGVNIWDYITPLCVYAIVIAMYFVIYKYYKKYSSIKIIRISKAIMFLGVLLLCYNIYVTIKLTISTGNGIYALWINSNGRYWMNMDHPIGLIAAHLLIFCIPGLVIAATKIPDEGQLPEKK